MSRIYGAGEEEHDEGRHIYGHGETSPYDHIYGAPVPVYTGEIEEWWNKPQWWPRWLWWPFPDNTPPPERPAPDDQSEETPPTPWEVPVPSPKPPPEETPEDKVSEPVPQTGSHEPDYFVAWVSAGDTRVCELCQANEDAGLIPMGSIFPSGHAFPPAHDRCRCQLDTQPGKLDLPPNFLHPDPANAPGSGQGIGIAFP